MRGLSLPPFAQFICVRLWGHRVLPAALPAPLSATLSPALSVYLCAMCSHRVCPWSDCLPLSSHTLPVSVPPQPHESSPPRCPSPPLLPVWMNVYFVFPWCCAPLSFDFLSVLVVQGGAQPPCVGRCVYLHRHLGSLRQFIFIL